MSIGYFSSWWRLCDDMGRVQLAGYGTLDTSKYDSDRQLKSHRVAASARNQPVRRHLDAFTRGRIIGKLEEGRSVTSVAAEFGIAHSIVSRLWRQFQTTGTAIRGSVVVVHEEPHPQMTGTLSYRPEETGGRQREKSPDTRHRRLTTNIAFYRGQKTARRWSVCTTPCTVCTFNACPSEKAFSVVPGTPELRDNEWGRVLFTDESRFSLSSDSHRILI
ncbi:hypothetical protein TNCV_4499481 [Trichonephila clavipes]|nr:hypothetical protein TNCV_4499481 [Trichonephila clavipes]